MAIKKGHNEYSLIGRFDIRMYENELQKRIADLKTEIDNLPAGSVTKRQSKARYIITTVFPSAASAPKLIWILMPSNRSRNKSKRENNWKLS